MVTYVAVQTELNTNWNAGVIAKPTFKNGKYGFSTKYPNFLFITIGKVVNKEMSLNAVLSEKKGLFTIRVVAANIADCEKFIGETQRILIEKSISGGWWRIIGEPLYDEKIKRVRATLLCQETLAHNKTSWS